MKLWGVSPKHFNKLLSPFPFYDQLKPHEDQSFKFRRSTMFFEQHLVPWELDTQKKQSSNITLVSDFRWGKTTNREFEGESYEYREKPKSNSGSPVHARDARNAPNTIWSIHPKKSFPFTVLFVGVTMTQETALLLALTQTFSLRAVWALRWLLASFWTLNRGSLPSWVWCKQACS